MTLVDSMPPASLDRVLRFGEFRLSLKSKTLTKLGQIVPLGGRAIAILVALIARDGEVVTHDELTAEAWPGVTVIQENLRVQIAGLRRALNDGPGRGSYI